MKFDIPERFCEYIYETERWWNSQNEFLPIDASIDEKIICFLILESDGLITDLKFDKSKMLSPEHLFFFRSEFNLLSKCFYYRQKLKQYEFDSKNKRTVVINQDNLNKIKENYPKILRIGKFDNDLAKEKFKVYNLDYLTSPLIFILYSEELCSIKDIELIIKCSADMKMQKHYLTCEKYWEINYSDYLESAAKSIWENFIWHLIIGNLEPVRQNLIEHNTFMNRVEGNIDPKIKLQAEWADSLLSKSKKEMDFLNKWIEVSKSSIKKEEDVSELINFLYQKLISDIEGELSSWNREDFYFLTVILIFVLRIYLGEDIELCKNFLHYFRQYLSCFAIIKPQMEKIKIQPCTPDNIPDETFENLFLKYSLKKNEFRQLKLKTENELKAKDRFKRGYFLFESYDPVKIEKLFNPTPDQKLLNKVIAHCLWDELGISKKKTIYKEYEERILKKVQNGLKEEIITDGSDEIISLFYFSLEEFDKPLGILSENPDGYSIHQVFQFIDEIKKVCHVETLEKLRPMKPGDAQIFFPETLIRICQEIDSVLSIEQFKKFKDDAGFEKYFLLPLKNAVKKKRGLILLCDD